MVTYLARNILVLLLMVLGGGALFGGGALIISPSGALLGMPLSMLGSSPFTNFLIPGIILFTALGLAPICTALALLKQPSFSIAERLNAYQDMHWAWTFSVYIALALITWIQVEMAYLQSVHWSHTLYMCWAIAIISVALLPGVRGLYEIGDRRGRNE